ncbi:MAG: Hsp20/alpha crystallin family protein [Deltaproteobacteria bacterium]|nr:Hsp20/alpha crystallin family protein [Deltaproteobacteria bacterium]
MTTKKEMAVKQKKELDRKGGETTRPGPVFIPAVDILENENEITILADMPGVDGKKVDIDLRDSTLTIYGRIDRVEGEKEVSVHREFQWGDYLRQFTISDVIDQEKITAKMEQGVLRLILPKAEKAKPQKIQVTTS